LKEKNNTTKHCCKEASKDQQTKQECTCCLAQHEV